MMRFEVNYTGANQLNGLLNGLREAFSDADRKGILSTVGNIYYEETLKRFDQQYDVDRKKWKPLRPVTVALKGHSRIGHKTGKLRKSIKMQFQGDSVFIGTNSIYARTFHYFVKKGSFGNGSPWGDIPRRSFIGRNKHLDDKAIKTLKELYVKKFGLDAKFVKESF